MRQWGQEGLRVVTRSCKRTPQELQNKAGVGLMEIEISHDVVMARHRLVSSCQDGAGRSQVCHEQEGLVSTELRGSVEGSARDDMSCVGQAGAKQ